MDHRLKFKAKTKRKKEKIEKKNIYHLGIVFMSLSIKHKTWGGGRKLAAGEFGVPGREREGERVGGTVRRRGSLRGGGGGRRSGSRGEKNLCNRPRYPLLPAARPGSQAAAILKGLQGPPWEEPAQPRHLPDSRRLEPPGTPAPESGHPRPEIRWPQGQNIPKEKKRKYFLDRIL